MSLREETLSASPESAIMDAMLEMGARPHHIGGKDRPHGGAVSARAARIYGSRRTGQGFTHIHLDGDFTVDKALDALRRLHLLPERHKVHELIDAGNHGAIVTISSKRQRRG